MAYFHRVFPSLFCWFDARRLSQGRKKKKTKPTSLFISLGFSVHWISFAKVTASPRQGGGRWYYGKSRGNRGSFLFRCVTDGRGHICMSQPTASETKVLKIALLINWKTNHQIIASLNCLEGGGVKNGNRRVMNGRSKMTVLLLKQNKTKGLTVCCNVPHYH